MKGRRILAIIICGIATYAAYKLYQKVSEAEKEAAEKFEKEKKEAIEEVEAELHQAEEWDKDEKSITLNNEKLKPADRAYSYRLYNEKYSRFINAKTSKELKEARKDFEAFIDILINTKDPETIEVYLKMDADAKATAEKHKAEQAARSYDLERYRAIGNIIEKVGTNVACKLMQ